MTQEKHPLRELMSQLDRLHELGLNQALETSQITRDMKQHYLAQLVSHYTHPWEHFTFK